jgi:hypothetical protein
VPRFALVARLRAMPHSHDRNRPGSRAAELPPRREERFLCDVFTGSRVLLNDTAETTR